MFAVYVFIVCYALLFLIFGLVTIETEASVWAVYTTIVGVSALMTIAVLGVKYLCIGLIFLLGA